MRRMKQCIAALALSAFSIAILSGFSDYEIATYAAENNEAIEKSVVGANETMLSTGAFQSDDGLTSSLTADELQQQIDLYDENVSMYFSQEYPAFNQYMDLNEYYLNDVFSDTVDYQVGSGVLDSKLVSVAYGSEGTTADADVYMQVYTLSVEGDGDGSYSVQCCVNIVQANASLKKEDSDWKVVSMELHLMEDWGPEDENQSSSNGGSAETASENNPQGQAAAITAPQYDCFESARNAALDFSIQQWCPIRIDDCIDITAETKVTKS